MQGAIAKVLARDTNGQCGEVILNEPGNASLISYPTGLIELTAYFMPWVKSVVKLLVSLSSGNVDC